MREKFVKWSKPLMLACMALDIWLTIEGVSIVFFGEYEHPQNPEIK